MLSNPSAYIHFPWCVKKCPYCDFNSHPLRQDTEFVAYLDALDQDWQSQQRTLTSANLSTVFLGGGTPSLFAPEQIETVLKLLPLQNSAEVTMEANPGTTEYADFAKYRQAGVNRLSIGAQSFNNHQLRQLGRIHAADETKQAFNNARLGGFNNINIDLMWGLPQQTVEEALSDLCAAIDLQPEHISWYQLTIEAKTEFAKRPPILPVEDTIAEIEKRGLLLLAEAGFQRYEVSAFAHGDHQCRHNINYWSFGDYLGVGAGAHGKLSKKQGCGIEIERTNKASQPRLYIENPTHTNTTPVTAESLVVEFMLNALRLIDGVSWEAFTTNTGLEQAQIAKTWEHLTELELVAQDRCATTPKGMRYLDSVVSTFLPD